MKSKIKSYFLFFIDPELMAESDIQILEEVLKNEKVNFTFDELDLNEKYINVIFTVAKKIKKYQFIKNKIVVFSGQDLIENNLAIKCNLFSYNEVLQFLDTLFSAEKKTSFQKKLKESEKWFDKIRELNELKNDEELQSSIKDYDSILDLEIQLLKTEKIADWNNEFKSYCKKSMWISVLSIATLDQVLEEETILDDNTLVFKLPFEDYILTIKIKNQNFEESSLKLEFLLSMIVRSLQLFDQNLIRTDEEIDFWKRIFAKIPYPMSVITTLGDLLVYNELFAKIGILPKECLSYKDQESIEINHQFYIVKKIEFEIESSKVFYFIFYSSERLNAKNNSLEDKKTSTNNVDDLGIVSSSIAHELNNPLAGILAALSLLMLEDNWTDEAMDEIADMQSGAKRCKELVEIFLGFSRFSPTHRIKASLKDSLDQALNLLRFRMVESNLRTEMRYQSTLESFSGSINPSILSMILYLIISELLTAFAHHRLITQKNSNLLSGEVLELTNQIIIRLDENFEYEEKLVQSKLIQHLLIFEKMEINFQSKEIRLIYRGKFL